MLDSQTKKRIDDARQILVGKVPDPKSQVEQITIALVYKFMDDMDRESEREGGKASFFVKTFAKYSWRRIFDPKLSGTEQLKTYSEALEKLSLNEALPELFREIFKNAYLPYRDPETLRLFLKTIGEFEYDHSERLGDAFEYLLSVLGSQGDAGQFRTPRHIIDFMVALVDPKKNESILDPACGTAGFLISAWKHIRAANTKKRLGDSLKPADKTRLMDNVVGYDISPDMVRLSLVNLYLHGFARPKIYEYDSLTSTNHWDEHFDVIMANPPFMSPKGGIRPHKKFSVESSRSEVLFVDYIAEHLLPTGRAAVIVPEGIIFQSQGAYKQLRKMLVEDCLVAVVSLPAGMFNPYSGVKTSILFLDKALARAASTIAFFKAENDGFGLGAQRREIEKNDLPQVKAELGEYLSRLRAGEAVEDLRPTLGLVVKKEKIAAKGEYGLSGERYREGAASTSFFPRVRLEDVCERIMDGTDFSPKNSEQGQYRYITAKNIKEWGLALDDVTYLSKADHDEIYRRCPVKKGDVLYIKDGATTGIATINPLDEEFSLLSSVAVLRGKEGVLDNSFLARYLNSPIGKSHMLGMVSGVAITRLTLTKLNNAEIPLPPLEVQKEIVAEIEGYQRVIDGARVVIENYRPHIAIRAEWPIFELSEVSAKITDGAHFTPTYIEAGVPFLRVTDITGSNTSKKYIPFEEHNELIKRCRPEKGDVLYSKNGTIGIAKLIDWDYEFSIFVSLALIKPKKKLLDPHYLECFLNSDIAYKQATARSKSGTVTNLHLVDIKTIEIPIPPLSTQRAIVAEIEAEQRLVAANRELIERFERKIQGTLARVWGEEQDAI